MQGIIFCIVVVVLIAILGIQYVMNLNDLKETGWREQAEKERAKNKELQYKLDHIRVHVNLEVRGFDK